MGNEETLKLIGDIGFSIGAFSANVFVILYMVMAPWWRTPFGRHMFLFMLTVALVFDSALINLFWPDFSGRLILRAFLYLALGLALLWRVVILVDVQMIQPWREVRRKRKSVE